jgi:hypothetical protein
MLKFVKKEHYKKGDHKGKIIITYSVSEIIIGILLVTLVGFYIYNYLDSNLHKKQPSPLYLGNATQGLKNPASAMPK